MASKDQIRQSLWEALQAVGANAAVYQQAAAGKTGLHGTDMACMEQLLANGALSAGEIAQRMGLATGTVTALIDRLEKAGYVQREHGKVDRRQVLVVPLTGKFEAEVGPVRAALADAVEHAMGDYSKSELRLILEFVAKANEATTREIERLREQQPSK